MQYLRYWNLFHGNLAGINLPHNNIFKILKHFINIPVISTSTLPELPPCTSKLAVLFTETRLRPSPLTVTLLESTINISYGDPAIWTHFGKEHATAWLATFHTDCQGLRQNFKASFSFKTTFSLMEESETGFFVLILFQYCFKSCKTWTFFATLLLLLSKQRVQPYL